MDVNYICHSCSESHIDFKIIISYLVKLGGRFNKTRVSSNDVYHCSRAIFATSRLTLLTVASWLDGNRILGVLRNFGKGFELLPPSFFLAKFAIILHIQRIILHSKQITRETAPGNSLNNEESIMLENISFWQISYLTHYSFLVKLPVLCCYCRQYL